MCGIVGISSSLEDATETVLLGLRVLQYRGYDSAGCVFIKDGKFICRKTLSGVDHLKEIVDASCISSKIGMAHTRWATHGKVTVKNAHPHCFDGIALVHNGVVENVIEMKAFLYSKGETFETETDTEVILKLIHLHKKEYSLPIENILQSVMKEVLGSFTVIVILETQPDKMFVAKRGPSLLISKNDKACMVASDVNAASIFGKNAVYLEDGDIAVVSWNNFEIFNDGKKITREIINLDDFTAKDPLKNHESFMISEILEQQDILPRILEKFDFEGIRKEIDLGNISCIRMIACGSSFFAGCIAGKLIEKYLHIMVVPEVASEFVCRSFASDDLFIFISQSGETADTLLALKSVKKLLPKSMIIGLTNMPGSAIARHSDLAIGINAGSEFSVAATKTFTAQLMTLLCIILTKLTDPDDFINSLAMLRSKIQIVIKNAQETFTMLVKEILSAQSILYIGKDLGYFVAQEGALKMKEISYIMAEAVPSGELKHGTLALVSDGFPVIVIAPHNDVFDKVFSSIQEVAGRGGKLIVFTDSPGKKKLSNTECHIIELPETSDETMPIIYTIAMQFLAYYVAKGNGKDIDHPRNLAKSITVE